MNTIEQPAVGISKQPGWGWDDAHVYNIECSCSDPDHSVQTWIEISTDDDFHNEIEVTFYVTTDYSGWRNFRERVSESWKVLWSGNSQRHHSLLLTKQSALNFAGAINKSIEDLDAKNSQPDA